MTGALIMAGGKSSRMRATEGLPHKSLVDVLGAPLIEHSVRTLLTHGFVDITVAVAEDEPDVVRWLRSHGEAIVAERRAKLDVRIERRPLGTIGAARAFASRGIDVLVVNVDNLSAIDLRALASARSESGAAMTVAVHEERFDMPFGEVRLRGTDVDEYLEKPSMTVCVSSGTYVLGPEACEAIPREGALGVPGLIAELKRRGLRISAYTHAAPWIDVNDAAGIARAELLLTRHAAQFAWLPPNR